MTRQPTLSSTLTYLLTTLVGAYALNLEWTGAYGEEQTSEWSELHIASPADVELRDPEVVITDPMESTTQAAESPDAEIAKRPRLLEKLMGQDIESSIKMNAPTPHPDPPSIEHLHPPAHSTDLSHPKDPSKKSVVSSLTKQRTPPQEVPSHVGDMAPDKSNSATETKNTSLSELDYAGFPKQPFRLTRKSYQLRNRMRQTLRSYYQELEIANKRSNWGMLHAIMVFGIDTKVRVGSDSYSTIAWIAGNNICRGQKILSEQDGKIGVKSGVGLQGHQGQLLAVFSLCDVPSDYPLYAGSTKYSVADVIEMEQLDCHSGDELTFTLIGLSHYLDTDATWTNDEGEVWNFERLIEEELSQPVVGAACGGTHRLMGFAHALRQRRAEGKPLSGQWLRAEEFTNDFVRYAYRLQNRDGSFSTDWFEGRENNGKLDRQVQTTGHIVEWLLTVTPDSQLQNPRLVSGIEFLLKSMYEERKHEWSIGPKGHALRSLAMYYERVYQEPRPWKQSNRVAHRRRTRR